MHAARATRATSTQREGRGRLSPKGVRKIGQLALRDIYQGLLRDRPGGHADRPPRRHGAAARTRRKPYRYGDPLRARPRRHAARRRSRAARRRRCARARRLRGLRRRPHAPRTSTVLLLDMSWSMSWEGRFAAAKKVAMAMESLIRSRYPRDYFAIVGFFTRAVELQAPRSARGELEHGRSVHQPAGRPAARRRAAGAPSEHQPAHHRHHRRPADRVLLARPALLRVAAVVRRHQHARRAGDAEGGRARHPARASPSTPSCSTTARACAPSSSA